METSLLTMWTEKQAVLQHQILVWLAQQAAARYPGVELVLVRHDLGWDRTEWYFRPRSALDV